MQPVQCIQCGESLLQEIVGTVTQFALYRSLPAGEQSEPIHICPGCGIAIDVGSVKEVSDE